MKNFKFINQSLWAGSSPNQTGETLTRQNRIGVKSWLNRGLMLLITILTLGVRQVWADDNKNYVGITCNNPDGYNVKLRVSRYHEGYCSEWEEWENEDMSEAGLTFEGKRLWAHDYHTCWGLYVLQFQYLDGSSWVEEWNAYSGERVDDYYNKYIFDYDGKKIYEALTFGTSKVYFDASGWSETNIRLVITNAGEQKYHDMAVVTGTKLRYTNTVSPWSNAMGVGVVGGETGTGGDARVGNGTLYTQWITDISAKAVEYTGLRNFGMNNDNADVYYIIENKGNAGEKPEARFSSDYTDLNSTQTYNTVVKAAGGSYTSGNSKSTISISSYELTGQGTTTNQTPELSTSESSETVDACRTATTRLQVGTPATGYQFDGWYTDATDGDLVSNSSDYTYYPTSANTYYARFSEKTFRVDFANDGHGTTTPTSGTNQTVGQITGVSVGASNSTGYHFSTWTISSGTGSFATGATTASNTFYPTSAATIRADFAPNNWTITLTNHDATTAGTTSIAVTYDSNSNLSGTPAITRPTKNGYNFGGYFTGENGTGTQIIDASGNVIASAGCSTYTNASKQWKYDGNLELHAYWTPKTLSFAVSSGSNWNTTANWTDEFVPTISHDVILTAPVTVNVTNAKAKSVLIDQSEDNEGKLTVGAGKALVVATTILKKNGEGETVATEETDIVLESDGTNGTGALVAGSKSADTKATVQFYSKAKKDGSGNYINQLNYYGSYLRKFDQPTDSWASITEEKLGPWTAYRIMRSETSEGTYNVGGTLILPGTGDYKTKTLTLNTSTHDNDNMFANSWTAPIDITKLDTENDFVGATATIYIFNAGSAADYASYGSTPGRKGTRAGQWIELPVSATMAVPGDYDLNVIPSQQAFLVQATSGGGEHSLKLDYEKLVYNPIATNGATITPTRAPKRMQAEDMEIVRLYLNGESGLGDRVLLYVSDDFSTDEMDNGWEAYKLPGSEFAPQFCANTPLGEMSISATKDIEGTVLGFYAGTEDDHYTFSFDYEGEGTWYLNDLDENESTVIDSANEYQFTATKGTVAEKRFTISKSPISKTPTGIEDVDGGVNARKLMMNGTLYIIRDGRIYNAEGSLVK